MKTRLLLILSFLFLIIQGLFAWSGSGTSGDPYQITSTADWNTLASNVANGNTYSNTYFKLTADITVTTMVTATFSGTFDGGGHILTFNYTATGDNAAPFAYITGATIMNLRVAGTINTGYKFAAGIAAQTDGTTNITNCQSSVTINSSVDGDGTHGGLIGCQSSGTLDISNCLFDGELLGASTSGCGGFVGWVANSSSYHTYISNSLFAPANITVTAPTFCRHKSSTLHLEASTCYYITPNWTASTVQGTNANSMTAEALVAALNNGTKNWCIYRGNAIPIMVNLVISTKAQWDTFAANVGNYDGKYVQLSANIGTANAPITAMTSGTFQGIFDGNGHTLTVNLTNSGGNVAPFYYLYGGTIMNLTVSGGVTTAGSFNAGLVARTHGGINYIQNCIIHTNVAVGDYGGGVVGHADNASSLTISDCIYDGTITHTGSYAGGFIGWYNNNQTLDLVMTNCLFKGDYTGNGQFHPIGVKKLAGIFKSINCTNCYYTQNPANLDDAARIFTDGTKVSELTIGTTGVSIASGSYATFQGTKYYYGTVTLGYNGPGAGVTYSLDGTSLSGNSFTISKDDAAFDDGTATVTAVTAVISLAANAYDGNYWTTFYCGHTGYTIDNAENAYAYTATVSGEEITLHKLGKVIPAGTAVIIVGADNSISMTASIEAAQNSVSNDLHGVDVATPVNTVLSNYSATALYMLSKKNDNLGFYRLATTDVPARKAFLALDNTQAALAPQLNMVFEDATDMQPVLEAEENELWFTIDGRLIGRKPTQPGIYISKGKKIFVK